MWADWLPRAEIHGIDLRLPDLTHDRIRMHQHSQCDESALSLLADDYFDVIIDDGSHHPAHQLQSIHYLWSKLRTGGLYFVEDVQDASYVKFVLLDDRSHIFHQGFPAPARFRHLGVTRCLSNPTTSHSRIKTVATDLTRCYYPGIG